MENYQTEIIIGKEFPKKVIPLIQQAKNSIDIAVYEWRWYLDQIGSDIQKFNNAIVVAQRKGKRVRVITSSQKIIDTLKKNKIEAKKIFSDKKLHIKLIIIDDEIAILGSHNYTMSAFTLNYEVSIKTQEKLVVNRLKNFFSGLWSY